MVKNRKVVDSKGVKVFSDMPPAKREKFAEENAGIIFKETKKNIHILEKDFTKIKYVEKGGGLTLEQYLKKFKFKDYQLVELVRCYNATQRFEKIKDSQIQLFLDRGLSNRFLERIYFLRTLVGSGVLPYLIVQFGISEGIKRFKTNTFKVNNPGTNHGGKFSATSRNFFKYEGLTEEEITSKIGDVKALIVKTKREHPERENARLEYWIAKYGDTQLARDKYYERCNTHAKDAFIRRYGEEEGTLKFNETVEKWLNTLNNKPLEEKERINRAKGSAINSKYKPGGPCENVRGICYYLKFTSRSGDLIFYKIGITKKRVEERFKKYCVRGLTYEIIDIFEDTLYNCFLKEQNILKTFASQRKNIILRGKQFTTEAFYENVLEGAKIENY